MPKNQTTETTHHMREGSVVVAMRPNTNKWQMRIKRSTGDWEIKSTKTTDLKMAKEIALERYDELRFRKKNDMPLDDRRKFHTVAEQYVAQLRKLADIGADKKIHETYIRHVTKYMIPFFGNMDLTEIDENELANYDNFLRSEMGKEPAKSSYNSHNVALRAVFNLAIQKKWLLRNQAPKTTVKGKGKAAVRRPHFENAEWNTLTNVMYGKKWRTGGKTWLSNYKREILRLYVLILGNTGMRPGVETIELKWKHVKDLKLAKNKTSKIPTQLFLDEKQPTSIVVFRVQGKTADHQAEGFRNVMARTNVEGWLDELKALTGKTEPDDYLFCTPDGVLLKDCPHMFTKLLSYSDLLEDASGQNRSLYSLRHMYATMAVRKGIPFQVLAQQMGTSVEMIERHYSHNKIEEWALELAG
jgi:integrase